MRRRTAYIGSGRALGGNVMWNRMNNRAKKRRKFVPLVWNNASKLANNLNLGFGNKPRGPGSMVSRIRNYRMDVTVKPVGTGSSYSYFTSRRKPVPGARILKGFQAPLYSVFNSGYRLTGIQGQQAYRSIDCMTAAQLHTLYLETSANQDGFFYVDWCRHRFMLQNQSEATTHVTLYEFVTRRDSATGPWGAFTQGMASIQAGAASTADDIGATPFMSPRFTENYRIIKKFNIELAQGRSHIHTSMYRVGRKYSDSRYEMDNTNGYLGTWTRGIFIIAHGTPYNSAADKTKVSTTPVALDIVTNSTFASHAPLVNKAIFEVQTDFPTFSDGQIIDIGSGEPDAVGDA